MPLPFVHSLRPRQERLTLPKPKLEETSSVTNWRTESKGAGPWLELRVRPPSVPEWQDGQANNVITLSVPRHVEIRCSNVCIYACTRPGYRGTTNGGRVSGGSIVASTDKTCQRRCSIVPSTSPASRSLDRDPRLIIFRYLFHYCALLRCPYRM